MTREAALPRTQLIFRVARLYGRNPDHVSMKRFNFRLPGDSLTNTEEPIRALLPRAP